MNRRFRQLAKQAHVTVITTNGMENIVDGCYIVSPDKLEKFAQLIVRECLYQVGRVDDMLEDEPAQKAAMAWVSSAIAGYFGVEESRTKPDQEAAEFIAAEDKKVASRYGYFPKLHPSEWKDK